MVKVVLVLALVLAFVTALLVASLVPAKAEPWVMPVDGAASVPSELVPEVWPVDVDGLDGPFRLYRTFRRFEQTVSTIPAGTVVIYDIEPHGVWRPPSELRHPRRWMRAFVRLAEAHGLTTMLAPSRSITRHDKDCDSNWFVKCGYPHVRADYFLLQVQRLECSPRVFERVVSRSAAIARSQIIVELTVAWPEACVTPETILEAHAIGSRYSDHFALWSAAEPHYRPWDEQVAMMTAVLTELALPAPPPSP